jgi:hypothetical protein
MNASRLQLPEGLSPERAGRLDGPSAEPWIRRAIVVLLGAIVVAALLDVFGQQPTTSTAAGPAATLQVQAPSRMRGGLIFQARFEVTARSRLARPALRLQRGWFEDMSVNSIEPSPNSETSDGDAVLLGFDPIDPGHTLTVWIYFQANPTNLGRQGQDVALTDGGRVVAAIRRSMLIVP